MQELRRPRAFAPDDPALTTEPDEPTPDEVSSDEDGVAEDRLDVGDRLRRSVHWGGILLAAALGLGTLAASLWVAGFVSIALARQDVIGWIAFGLLVIAGVATAMLTLREAVGFFRLARLDDVRDSVEAVLRNSTLTGERESVGRLKALFSNRPELKWRLRRLAEHERDVRDAGELLRLAEREILAPLDSSARRRVLLSAKRVSIVTAMSPWGALSVLFVLYENIGLLRAVAGLYGGRPGMLGGIKLARMVGTHIVATGGLALTDDLIGQFLGQDALRRLSHKLGEGAFNGALTARIGVVGLHVCRPMPFLEAQPVRVRDLLSELLRQLTRGASKGGRLTTAS